MPTWTSRLKSAAASFASLFAGTAQASLGAGGTGGDPFGWVLSGSARTPLLRGRLEILQGYGTMPWLRAVTHRVATATAAVERTLSVRDKRGELQPLASHPLLDLLAHANPLLGGHASLQLTQLSLDLVGEAFWLLERNALGMPVAYWPLSPAWVTQVPGLEMPFFRVSAGVLQAQIPVTEMVWFKDIHPLTPYGHGHGLGQTLSDELETDEYAAKHTKAWFYNSARPDIIVTADGLHKDDTKRLEEDWNRRNKGFWNAFKTYFLNKKVDVTALSHTFADMELIKLRQYERDVIIQIYGVPPEMLGIVEHSNRATIIESNTIFSTYVLIPRLSLQTDTLQRLLVPQFDARLILGYVSPVPEDREYKLNVMKAAPQAFLIDQWQAAAGEPPLPNGAGQVFYVPTKQTVHNNLDAPDQPTSAVPPVAPPKRVASNEGRVVSDQWLVASEDREGSPSDSPLATSHKPLATTKRDSAEAAQALQALADRLEPGVRAAFLTLITAMIEQTPLADLSVALASGHAQAALDAIPWAQLTEQGQSLTDLLTAALGQAGAAEAAALSQELGVTIAWDLADAHAVAAAQQLTFGLIEELSATSQAAIRTVIEQGLAAGTPTAELAAQIRQDIGLTTQQAQAVERFRADLTAQGVDAATVERRVARYAEAQRGLRSDVIARTSVMEAIGSGQQAAWNQAVAEGNLNPDDWRKVWYVTDDDALCTTICEPLPEMPENQAVPISGSFTLPDGRQLQTPPAHPRCRCVASLRYTATTAQAHAPQTAAAPDPLATALTALARALAHPTPVAVHVAPAALFGAPVLQVPGSTTARTIEHDGGLLSRIVERQTPGAAPAPQVQEVRVEHTLARPPARTTVKEIHRDPVTQLITHVVEREDEE
jgi:HK97 family phage portal protein